MIQQIHVLMKQASRCAWGHVGVEITEVCVYSYISASASATVAAAAAVVCCSGVFTPGKADSCVTSAMSYILTAPQPDPLEYNMLLADVGDKSTAARSR